jgi:hypothetical protein
MSKDEETRLAGDLYRIAGPVYQQSEGYFSNDSNLPVKAAFTRWTANHTDWTAGRTVLQSIQNDLDNIRFYNLDTRLDKPLTDFVDNWRVALDDLSKGSTDWA